MLNACCDDLNITMSKHPPLEHADDFWNRPGQSKAKVCAWCLGHEKLLQCLILCKIQQHPKLPMFKWNGRDSKIPNYRLNLCTRCNHRNTDTPLDQIQHTISSPWRRNCNVCRTWSQPTRLQNQPTRMSSSAEKYSSGCAPNSTKHNTRASAAPK